MSERVSSFLQQKYICGIPPHLGSLSTVGQNREATAEDSRFATREAMMWTYPMHMLTTYAATGKTAKKEEIVASVRKYLITKPDLIPFFYDKLQNKNIPGLELQRYASSLKTELMKTYEESAMKLETKDVTEDQIFSAYKLAHSDSELTTVGAAILMAFC